MFLFNYRIVQNRVLLKKLFSTIWCYWTANVKYGGWWAGQDLNLRPQPRKGCVLTRLDDRPALF